MCPTPPKPGWDAELSVQLSRADFQGTWPTARTEDEKKIDADFYAALTDTDAAPNNPNEYAVLPVTGANNGIQMSQLVGLPFDDPQWDVFLDQFTVKQMTAPCPASPRKRAPMN